MPKIYKPKIPLWPEQERGLKKMAGEKAFALFMAMRTGKTPTTLADFGRLELAGKAKDFMLISLAGVYRTWLEAINNHLSDDLRKRISIYLWYANPTKSDRKRLDDFLEIVPDSAPPRFFLINVEAFSRPGEGREVALKFLNSRHNNKNYVAVDESTIIKNKSKRTDFIIKRIKPLADYRRILSGLATPRSPMDLFFQFEFLDWNILGFRSWYAFRSHIAIMKQQWFGGRSVMLIDKEKGDNGFRPDAIKELQGLIEPYSYRVPFRPKVPSTYEIREVEMTKDQAKYYRELKEFATTELASSDHVTATVVIAQIMRMHQVLCGHVMDENGKEHSIPENKTAALLELLEDCSCKVVIWFTYISDLNRVMARIEEEYGNGSTAQFSGANLKGREADEHRFKNDPLCRFMGATAGAGGRGRTWSNADLVIYYSSSDDLEKREQSEQRAHGRDKENGVDYVDIIVPGTVEEKILHALRKKINMSSAINGDNYKEWLI